MTVSYSDPAATTVTAGQQAPGSRKGTEDRSARTLALAVLDARRIIRVDLPVLGPRSSPYGADPPLRAIEHALNRLKRLANRAIRRALRTKPMITIRPDDSDSWHLALIQTINSSLPVEVSIRLDLTEKPEDEIKPIVDSLARSIADHGGVVSQISPRLFLLTRAGGQQGASYPLELRASADRALRLVHLLDLEAIRPGDSHTDHLRTLSRQLRDLMLPLDLSGIDLTGLNLSIEDLAGAIWTVITQWPSAEIAKHIQDISEEVASGVYQVRTGTERDPADSLV